jgi:hypothetical protein
MEVHHHSHTERKKWAHYLWEFLMLFLAVFCGFLAENQREHMIEHQREKQYIRSLIQDIGKDTANVTFWISLYDKLHAHCDTVLTNFNEFAKNESITAAESYSKVIFGFPDFIYTDHTMQQLKNAGALRLIRNKTAIDSIIAYDAKARDVSLEETAIAHYYQSLNDLTNKLLSYRRIDAAGSVIFNVDTLVVKRNFWLKPGADSMEELYNMVYKYRETIKGFVDHLEGFKERGDHLMTFLKKEYHLN